MSTDKARKALLAHLDGLSFSERIRHVATLAHSSDDRPNTLALVDALRTGDAYEAGLSVAMAQALRDVPRLAAAMAHRSYTVRCTALSYLVQLVSDAPVPADSPDIAALIHGLAPALRRAALKGLVRHGKRSLARALFADVLAHHGPREAAALLPALEPDALRVHLPALAHAGPAWRALLRRHPDIVVDHLRDSLDAAPLRDRAGVWRSHGGLLAALAELRPRALFDLLELFPGTLSEWTLIHHAGELVRADPERLLAQLERPPVRDVLLRVGLPRRLLTHVHALSPTHRIRLGALVAEQPERLAPLLREVPPSQRAAILDKVYQHHGRDQRVWPDVLLDSLPHRLRRREAARMRNLPAIQADPDRVLALTAHLDLSTALPILQRAMRAADADERGRAVARTIACAARDTTTPDGFHTTLAAIAPRLRNEQDPIRLIAFQALAAAPSRVFTPADADTLLALATAATEARDLSYPTRAAIQKLAFKLLRDHADAADSPLFAAGLDILRLLAGQSGTLVLPDLSRGLPQKTAPALVAALRPRIVAGAARERHDLVLALATALGKRAHGLAALSELLEPLTTTKPDAVAGRAIVLLLADPGTRDARVRTLIAADRSAIVFPIVHNHLHRRRQAWLDPFLDGTKISGRFLTGKTLYLPPFDDGFHRWLPRQQQAFARLIERAASDKDHPSITRAGVIARLARLPITAIADFDTFLRSTAVPVVEAALGALAWTDTPAEALPVLLEHLDGDRARVAMYAVPRVARFIPPEELAVTLTGLLTGKPRKITVRKEALRLLGVHRSPHSVPALAATLAQPDVHKDLVIAVGHAARNLLDDPRAFELLANLAASPEPDIARSLLDPQPEQLPAQVRRGYARLVLAVAGHRDLTARRAAIRVLPTWSSGQESECCAELATVVLDLANGHAWPEASVALVAIAREDSETLAALATVVAQLAAHASDPNPPDVLTPATAAAVGIDAGALTAPFAAFDPEARDLPARQRLFAVHAALLALERSARLSLRTGLAALADILAADDLWPLAAGLRLAGLDLASPVAVATLRDVAADPRADAFLGELVACLEGQVADAVGVDPGALLARGAALAPTSATAARLAVVLVAAAGRRTDWPTRAAAVLSGLRGHPDVRVRTAARGVFTRPEAAVVPVPA